jgi:hypothetical protein
MSWTALTVVHIAGGAISIAAGFVALFAEKGAWAHRTAGSVFFIAMLIMSAVAAYLAFRRAEQVIGVFTFYLVATAWVTVMRKERKIGRFEVAAFFVPVALAVIAYFHALAIQAGVAPPAKDEYPAQMYFVIASFAAFAAVSDAAMLVRRGVGGAQRIARHLWRMSFAMLIATGSYFLGQPKFVPAILRETNLNLLPVLLVIALLLFWLVRVLFTRWYARGASEPSHGVAQQSA